MKKKRLSLASFIFVTLFLLSSCEITRPICATSNPIGNKKGKSTAIGILMFPPFAGSGNAGIERAAKDGNITKISTVDYQYQWFLLFQKWTCIVTGE